MPSSLLRNFATQQFALIVLITALPVIPLLLLGYPDGHDLNIHLRSWVDASAQLRHGILFPQWASGANYGFGEPRFIFYPPASWMLGAILGLFLPWRTVPAVFVWLTLILAAVAMRKLAQDWLPPRQALAAGLLYAFSPYLLVNANTRCAFGELLASAIFPLLLWGAFRLERDSRQAFTIIALSFAGIWLANLPSAVIATYSLGSVLLILSAAKRSWKPLVFGSGGAVSGLALTAFTLVPAAWERRWVTIDAVMEQNKLPSENFLFTHNSLPLTDLFNRRLSILAVLMILGAIVGAIFAQRLRREARGVFWSLAALCVLSGFLMIKVSSVFWQFLPELRFVQFPWRWLFALCAAGVPIIVSAALQSERRKRVLCPALLAMVVLIDCAILYTKDAHPHIVDDIYARLQSGRGYSGLREYRPLGSRNVLLGHAEPLIAVADSALQHPGEPPAGVYVELWDAERKLLRADLPSPVTVDLKLLAYPAWNITMDGKPIALLTNPKTGQIRVSLPAGASRTEITLGRTADRRIGIVISLISGTLLSLRGLLAYRRKAVATERLQPKLAEATG